MTSFITLSAQAAGLGVTGPDDVTLDITTWLTKHPTALVTVYNGTDDVAFICAAGETGGENGRLIPSGGSLIVGPIKREEGELVIHALGSGNIYYSFNMIGSEG